MELRISIDDGRKEMLPFADLLDKYGLKGVFYIAPFENYNTLRVRDIRELAERHEVGGHTLNHTRLTGIPLSVAKNEIEIGKQELEDIIGKKIKKFAYPRGWYNPDVMELVRNAGYIEGRTMTMGITDRTGYDDMAIPVTAQNYPRKEYEHGMSAGILEKLDEAIANGYSGYFNLVVHTDDIGRFRQLTEIDSILHEIAKRAKI